MTDQAQEHGEEDSKVTLVAWLADHPGSSVDDAQKALNWSKSQLAKAMTDDARRLAVRHRTGSSRKWSEAEILDALRAAWAAISTAERDRSQLCPLQPTRSRRDRRRSNLGASSAGVRILG